MILIDIFMSSYKLSRLCVYELNSYSCVSEVPWYNSKILKLTRQRKSSKNIKALFADYFQTVYQMTECRGRALIVSNDYNQTRRGSEHDYQNIKCMLDKLGFVTVGDHKNYTARVS